MLARSHAPAFAALILTPLIQSCTLIGVDPGRNNPLLLVTRDDRSLAERLRAHVTFLAATIGERNLATPGSMEHAERYLVTELARSGYTVRWQTYQCADHTVSNLEVEIAGRSADPATAHKIIVIGAHYDTIHHRGITTPGANDNASGVAGVLELARLLKDAAPARTIRLVLFANEEPPHFWTDDMGSLVYARAAAQRSDPIVGMLAIESIGYFRDERGSQSYPPLVGMAYPSTGDFIAFVGPNSNGSGDWIEHLTRAFRNASDVPAEGAALPSLVPRINSSDHWSFWKQGWPACMVTDTAPYRDPAYHKPTDTPDRLDYDRMARVVEGLHTAILTLADANADKTAR